MHIYIYSIYNIYKYIYDFKNQFASHASGYFRKR